MTTKQKSKHYEKLNRRFDDRAALLREMGFKYTGLDKIGAEGHNLAVFTRPERFKPGKHETIAAGYVLAADPVLWDDTVARLGYPVAL